MNRTRTVLVGFGTWCAVVALVSTAVWVVILRAGQGVVPVGDPRAAATNSLAVPHRHHGAKPPAARSSSPAPSSHPSPKSTGSPPANPNTTHTTATTAPPSQPKPTHSSSPPNPGPVAERRSWNGTAGHVVTECRAVRAQLVSAYPNTGWRYEVISRGPDSVRVGFLPMEEHEGVKVTAQCVSGVPHYSVTDWESGDDDHE